MILHCSLFFGVLLWIVQSSASTVSDEFVLMPNGRYFHTECIHHFDDVVTSSDHGGMTHFATSQGTEVHPPCPYQSFSVDEFQRRNMNPAVDEAPENLQYYSSWVANAQYAHSSGYGNMYSEWKVPAAPKSNGPAPPLVASSVYLFNGLEDGGGTRGQSTVIIQPVLSWGKSGCILFNVEHWYLTSFVVSGNGRAICGKKLGPLTEGELVAGNMTLLDASSNEWVVESTRKHTGEVSSQSTSGLPVLDAAYLTLEGMVIYSCQAFPASGGVAFTANSLSERGTGAPIKPIWKEVILKTECDQKVAITDTDVEIAWDINKYK